MKDYSSYNLRDACAEHEERFSEGNVRNTSSQRRLRAVEPAAQRCFLTVLTVHDVTHVWRVKAAWGTSFHVGGNRVCSECRDDATFRF